LTSDGRAGSIPASSTKMFFKIHEGGKSKILDEGMAVTDSDARVFDKALKNIGGS
jgi:hypothetical protein